MLYRAFQSEHAIAEVLQAATRRILPARSEKKKTRQSVSSLHGQAAFPRGIADGSGIQSPVCRSSGSEFSLFSLHGTCRRQTHVAATVQSATDPRCCYRAGPPVLLCIPPRISQILNLINSIHQETYSVSFLKEYLQRLKQMN